MDKDMLYNSGEDNVRHQAAEYSCMATGKDKIHKTALPKVMQVKKFGLDRGLAKEDTTDEKMEFLPICGQGGGSADHVRGDG
jgi:microfibrillar-associated protein 1